MALDFASTARGLTFDRQNAIDTNTPRFSPIFENDHAGYIWIVGIVALIYSLMATVTRCFVKMHMFGTDDYLLISSTFLHVAQSIAVFTSLDHGLGKYNSITDSQQWVVAGKAYYASQVMFFLALSLSKCSILALILRVVEDRESRMRKLCIATIALSAIWGLLSALLVTVSCSAEKLLIDGVQCSAQEARNLTITAIDVITEAAICIFPVALVWPVHMKVSLKFQVIVAFLFRIPLVPLALVRMHLLTTTLGAAEPLFAATDVVVLNQVILCWSIISANIPNLKSFLKSFFTGLGYPVNLDGTTTQSGTYDASGRGNSYALRSMNGRSARSGRSGNASVTATQITINDDLGNGTGHHGSLTLRPDGHEHKTRVLLNRKGSQLRKGIGGCGAIPDGESDHSRSGSQEMIIRREMEWQVTHEERR